MRLKPDFQQSVSSGKVLMQMNGCFGKHSAGDVEGLHSLCGFDFEQDHSVGGQPSWSDIKQAADSFHAIGAAIERESGFVFIDRKVSQCPSGNIGQVSTDQVEVVSGGNWVSMRGKQITLYEINSVYNLKFDCIF